MDKKLCFGVHNDEYNLDYYDDGSLEVYNHVKRKLITIFDEEIVALFVAMLEREGYLDHLLEVEKKRLVKIGFPIQK